jgi:hypothetical protein
VVAELQQPAGLATVFVPLFGDHLVTDNLQILCSRLHRGGVVAHRIVLRDMRVASSEFQ